MSVEMPHKDFELVDSKGKLQTSKLRGELSSRTRKTAVDEAGISVPCHPISVVAMIGAQRSGCSSLVNQLFGTDFQSSNSEQCVQLTHGIRAQFAQKSINSGTVDVLILDVEGFDNNVSTRIAVQERAARYSALISDVLVVNVFFHNLHLEESSGRSCIVSAFDAVLKAQNSNINFSLIPRKKILIVVRDYDSDECSHEDLTDAYMSDLNQSISKHSANPSEMPRLSDIFDIEFEFMPNAFLDPTVFCSAANEFSKKVTTALCQRSMNAPGPDSLEARFSMIWKLPNVFSTSSTDPAVNRASPSELEAALLCDRVAKQALAEYSEQVRPWKDSSRMVREFGAGSTELIDKILSRFDTEASVYGTTTVFKRKRSEMQSHMLLDLQALYAKQILKLRDLAYHVFKDKLNRTQLSHRIEQDVDKAIAEADAFFTDKATGLRSKYASSGAWHFESERKELLSVMRETATERLQLSRLQGSYVPRMRYPVVVSFHHLSPAPFGQDSRFQQPLAPPVHAKPDPDAYRRGYPGTFKIESRMGASYRPKKPDYESMLKLMEEADIQLE